MDFAEAADHIVEIKEYEKRNKFPDVTRELKKTVEHEGNGDANCNLCVRNNTQRIGKRTGRL